MTRRICFALDLVDDAESIAEYERMHAPGAVWPEITAGLRAAGYQAVEIWRTGDRLFMVAEVGPDWPRPLPAHLAGADARWQMLVDRFQKRLGFADGDQKWVPMDRIYIFDGQ